MTEANPILAMLLLLTGVSEAWPQAPSIDLAKLQARIDTLEAENTAIKRELAQLKGQLVALLGSPKQLPQTEENKLKKAVFDSFEDLGRGRLRSAYLSMSQPYQKRTDRASFDAFIAEHKKLTRLFQEGNSPLHQSIYKFRKLAKDKAYECDLAFPSFVLGPNELNLTLRLIEEEGTWGIDDFVEMKGDTR
jgi:hypothetical protein